MKFKTSMLVAQILAALSISLSVAADIKEAELGDTGNVCDSSSFLQAAKDAEKLRRKRRVSTEDFAKMMQDQKTIILDARDSDFFRNLHIEGSVNLPYTRFSATTLSSVVPSKTTRILIYCSNNLQFDALRNLQKVTSKPNSKPFAYPTEPDPPKLPHTGLNIPTFITLFSYGYTNIWELNDLVDPTDTILPFTGTALKISSEQGAAANP